MLPARDKEPGEAPGPELELLLCTARTRMDPARADRIKALLLGQPDWEYLMSLAQRHGLRSMMYWQLNATCPEAAAGGYLGRLRDCFYENTRRSLLLTGEMLRTIDLLKREGILAVPLKGPVLAESCYGHLGLREAGDIDLLVHKGDVPMAWKLLVGEGYQPLRALPGSQGRVIQNLGKDLHLRDASGGIYLDLKHDLLPGFDSDHFLNRIEEVTIGGKAVPALCAEDTLLFLCLHGAKHLWERLLWTCDVSELIRSSEDLDWDAVINRAGRLRCRRILFLGLLLAHDLLGAALPVDVARMATGDKAARSIADEIRRRVMEDVPAPTDTLGQALFLVRATEYLRGKVRLGVRIACASVPPTAAEKDLVSLPPALSFLYWIIRPIRLIGKYGSRALRNRT